MDINSLLKGRECECQRTHTCPIKHIYVEDGAIMRLRELTGSYNSILLVADENTFSVAGKMTKEALKEKKTSELIFSGKTLVIPNEESIERVRRCLDGVDLIIGIGSGVIQDLCKYVAHFSALPYMVVATAPSMDGYASSGAAMILKGMKETVPANLPVAIVAELDVLATAPIEMIKAGYGDIIGKYSALCDWELSSIVNGEYFCSYIYRTTLETVEKTLSTADGLLKRDKKSVGALMEALITVGIMMSFATSSRPASGSEHHLSHFFEITGIINNTPYLAHGIDVAYSTVITTQIREALIKKMPLGEQFSLKREDYLSKMDKIYGPIAGECVALQDRVGAYKRDRMSTYRENWAKIKEIFEKAPTSSEIKQMLSLAELDVSELYKTYGEERLRTAIAWAKDLKDRYTVLWMGFDILGEESEAYGL